MSTTTQITQSNNRLSFSRESSPNDFQTTALYRAFTSVPGDDRRCSTPTQHASAFQTVSSHSRNISQIETSNCITSRTFQVLSTPPRRSNTDTFSRESSSQHNDVPPPNSISLWNLYALNNDAKNGNGLSLAELEQSSKRNDLAARDARRVVSRIQTEINRSTIAYIIGESPTPIIDTEGRSPTPMVPQEDRSPTPMVPQEDRSPFNGESPPAARSSKSQDDDYFDDSNCEKASDLDEQWWQQFNSPHKNRRSTISPSQSREVSPSRAPSAISSPLPLCSENHTCKDRWYRFPEADLPGIIIDSHQAKHVVGALFGSYIGAHGDKFNIEHSTAEGLKNVLDYLLKQTECSVLNSIPRCLTKTEIVIDGIQKKDLPYDKIKISSIAYLPEQLSWCFHTFPVLPKRNT
ncbi:MAG TPA: hypothetical protein VLE96_01485 [Chlamydiales bacterium]|nr:hypothetical protein [Chlamydiales bacterium]